MIRNLTNEELLSDLLIWHVYVARDPDDEENVDRFYDLLQETKRRMAYFEHLGERV